MRFDPTSWRQCARDFAVTADSLSDTAQARLDRLSDVAAAGSTADRTTLVDDAIASLVPVSVEYVGEVIDGICSQFIEESSGLYDTGLYYNDVEQDNTLSAKQVAEALAETPYNS